MTEHAFDKDYWDRHWEEVPSSGSQAAHPYLAVETKGLTPGTALEAGCGAGNEAIWLARAGWTVTAVDLAAEAIARGKARGSGLPIEWVEADLSTWSPGRSFELVTTHYAHPTIPQLDFYARIAEWVAPGGTLLIVGHLHPDHQHEHASGHDEPPAEATATAATIADRLQGWGIVTAAETHRTVGPDHPLHDVVVRARR